nr:tetratricopeptide repeat protein [Corynebacterium simulans]
MGALKQQKETEKAPSGVSAFFEVTEANFESELIRRSAEVPVIALIGSSRSPASEQLKNDLRAVAEAGGLKFIVGYIDADAIPQVAQVFGVRNLPTTVALAAGQPITNFEGAQPKDALEQWTATLVEKLGPQLSGLSTETSEPEPAADPRVQAAEESLNRGDFDAAIAHYDAILADDPDNAEAKQARNTTQVLRRLDPANRTEDPIAAADAAPNDVAKQCDAADAEVVAGAPEKAFERLISAMQTTAGDDKQALKDRLLELFALFDASDSRVLQARTKLASALY